MRISTVQWAMADLWLNAAAGSVVGNRYRENYDVLHLDPDKPLAVVADGMGSGVGSATAGSTAVEVFVRTATPQTLRATVADVQAAVREKGRAIPDLTGCTLTAFVGGAGEVGGAGDVGGAGEMGGGADAWLVQIGDSRVYRLRNGLLELLTVDHTAAWLGLLHGWFTPDSAEAHAARYRLFRYVGHPELPEPDLLHISVRPNDRFLICTDGVSDQISYEGVQHRLEAGPDPAASVEAILQETLVTGDDNATAIVISAVPSATAR